MKNIILSILLMSFLIASVSAYQTIFQENANWSQGIDNNQWVYVNYTKPANLINSTWQLAYIPHTSRPQVQYFVNVSIPSWCSNANPNSLGLRFTYIDGSSYQVYGQCFNGTGYQNVYSRVVNTGEGWGSGASSSYTYTLDGDYGGTSPCFDYGRSGGVWALCTDGQVYGFSEESMYFNVRETQSITPLLNSQNANISLLYPQALFVGYNGTNKTEVFMSIDGDPVYLNQFYIYEVGTYIATWEMFESADYTGFNDSLTFTVSYPSGYTGLPNKIEGTGSTYQVLDSAGSGISRFLSNITLPVAVFIFIIGIIVLIISITILLRNLFTNGLRKFSLRA